MHTLEHTQYTEEDKQVWSLLYERQWEAVRQYACSSFAKGLQAIGLRPGEIPAFENINERLWKATGWKIYPVPGLIPNRSFFKLMVFKRFGATTWLRRLKRLDYLEEPDMFHDVFGHIPLLADPRVAGFLHRLAYIAEPWLGQDEIVEQIAWLYWFTIEFGLVREGGQTRIYGAGILSSIAETRFALSTEARHVPFDLGRILATPYIKDRFQDQYFVLDSLDDLDECLEDLDDLLRANNHEQANGKIIRLDPVTWSIQQN